MFARKSKLPASPLNALEVQVAKLVTVKANGLGLIAAPIVLMLILLILIIGSMWGGSVVRNGISNLVGATQSGPQATEEPPRISAS